MRPTAEEIESGVICMSVGESPGTLVSEAEPAAIFRSDATKIWEYSKKKDFHFKSVDGSRSFLIKRKGYFPTSFEIAEDGKPVAIISTKSVLRNRYSVALGSGEIWTVRIPLFTIYFAAASTTGRNLWIKVGPSWRQWNVLLPNEDNAAVLLCALAFIQRRWV